MTLACGAGFCAVMAIHIYFALVLNRTIVVQDNWAVYLLADPKI